MYPGWRDYLFTFGDKIRTANVQDGERNGEINKRTKYICSK